MLTFAIGSIIGIVIGRWIQTQYQSKKINDKLNELKEAREKVKNANNQFLLNFSKIYDAQNNTQDKFTDLDMQLMDMWID